MTISEGAPTCHLCGGPFAHGGANRSFGLDLCEHCFEGDVFSRLAHRGFEFKERHRTETRYRGTDRRQAVTVYIMELYGSVPHRINLAATFSRETFGNKIVKLFKREIQVGDPLFDDMVYVSETKNERAVAELLRPDGMQSAIMEFLAGDTITAGDSPTTGHVRIAGNKVEAYVESYEEVLDVPGNPYKRSLAAMLHFLDVFARGFAVG
jgi:hypothetical protein